MALGVLVLLLKPAQAQNNYTFSEDTAKQILIKLEVCEETDIRIKSLINNYREEKEANERLVENFNEKIRLFSLQMDDEHERAEKYRLEWKKCGEALVECRQSTPSKTVWFGYGFGSGILVALLLILL